MMMMMTAPKAAAFTTVAAANAASQRFLQVGLPMVHRLTHNEHARVGQWLLGTSGLVVGMIQVGALTRLTQSGLSMTTWSPLGSLPPLSLPAWQEEFERYKQFPEWQQRQQMTLREFQYIYAWEYGHRMFGRALGVVFVAPWIYFTVRGKIPKSYQGKMVGLLAMGGTQGLVGWWMVKSGLGEDRRGDKNQIRVKPLRLAAHLSMAFATYAALLWTGLDILQLPHTKTKLVEYVSQLPHHAIRLASRLRTGSIVFTSLTAVTVVSGALVAGSDAGRAFNTYPTMDGDWIPPQVWRHFQPWWRNAYEDTATIQWNHRLLASSTTVAAFVVVGTGLGKGAALLTPQVRLGLLGVGLAVTGQVTLGITTLLYYVPISLAALHQLGSVVVFTSGLYLTHSLRYARPAIVRAATAAASKSVPP